MICEIIDELPDPDQNGTFCTFIKPDTYGAGADAECHHVGDGCHGDGDPGVLHGEGDLLLHRASALAVLLEVAHTLQDDEHVVDADT